jgi:hypothetical protein
LHLYVLFYSLYGNQSRLGELRLALGIMPVPTAETEPTGQAGPSKPAKPFANPLMAKFLGKAVVKPVIASKDDGESAGSMSEGEIQLAAAASRIVSRNFQENWKKLHPWLLLRGHEQDVLRVLR